MSSYHPDSINARNQALALGKSTIKGLLFLFGLAAAGYALRMVESEHLFTVDWADKTMHAQTLGSIGIYLGLGALFTAIGLPRQVVSFIAGYTFGVAWGLLLALFATLLGAGCTFFYARFVGRSLVRKKLGKRLSKVDAMLSSSPLTTTLLIRFMPVGSNLVTNLVGGVSSIPARWFFLGSALGLLPQTFIFALLGSGVQVDPVWRTSLSVILFFLSTLLGIYLFRRFRMGRLLDTEE